MYNDGVVSVWYDYATTVNCTGMWLSGYCAVTVLYVQVQRDAVCGVAVRRRTSTKRFHLKVT